LKLKKVFLKLAKIYVNTFPVGKSTHKNIFLYTNVFFDSTYFVLKPQILPILISSTH